MVASALAAPALLSQALAAPLNQAPPPDLVRTIARRESETQAARDQYAFRQTVIVEELDDRGARKGEYRQVRDIIFSPGRERIEKIVEAPAPSLKRLILTPEDFSDIRDIQPFLFREEHRRLYEVRFRGEETIDGVACWVLQVRPRQILDGQRLFEGMLWAAQSDASIVRMDGRAAPDIRTKGSEHLFPRFTTVRRPVDGRHWFPVHTYADDTLNFRHGLVRIRLTVRYANYQRFGAESTITFEPKP